MPSVELGLTTYTELLVKATIKDTAEYNAIEALLKGVEHALPDGKTFPDKDGHERGEVRIKWWVKQNSKLCDIAMPPPRNFGRH